MTAGVTGAPPANPAQGQADFEPRWPAVVAVLVAIALYASLPDRIISGAHASNVFRIVVPLLALALLIPLAVTAPHRHVYESGRRRALAIALTAVVSLANVTALVFLLHYLLVGGPAVHGRQLLLGGAQIWWTNVIAFALWFWSSTAAGRRRGCATRGRRVTSPSSR